VQQRAGVMLAGGVGAAGDRYEQHADAVADAVVAGRSAEGMLDTMAGGGAESARSAGAASAGSGVQKQDAAPAPAAPAPAAPAPAAPAPAAPAPAPGSSEEDRQIVASLIAQGIRNEVELTNAVFFHHYPELEGTLLAPNSDGAKTWIAIRDDLVRPALNTPPAAGAPAAGAPAQPAPAQPAPDTGECEQPATAPAEETGFIGGMVNAVTGFFSDMWNHLAGNTEVPIDESIECPVDGPDGTSPGEAKAPASSEEAELTQLMNKARLTPEEITRARELIATLPKDQQAEKFLELQSKPEYANQRDNESSQETKDGGTCNLTSVAMALMNLGIPLSAVTARIQALSPPQPAAPPLEGIQYEDGLVRIAELLGCGSANDLLLGGTWEKVAGELGAKMHWLHYADGGHGKITRPQWEAIRDTHLAAGNGVIVSIWGHVIRLQAVNELGLVVDDPYGKSTLLLEARRDRKKTDGTLIAADSKYNWETGGINTQTDGEGSNKGEDLGYPWKDVETYDFGAVMAFSK
jgi:hypothetical protein